MSESKPGSSQMKRIHFGKRAFATDSQQKNKSEIRQRSEDKGAHHGRPPIEDHFEANVIHGRSTDAFSMPKVARRLRRLRRRYSV